MLVKTLAIVTAGGVTSVFSIYARNQVIGGDNPPLSDMASEAVYFGISDLLSETIKNKVFGVYRERRRILRGEAGGEEWPRLKLYLRLYASGVLFGVAKNYRNVISNWGKPRESFADMIRDSVYFPNFFVIKEIFVARDSGILRRAGMGAMASILSNLISRPIECAVKGVLPPWEELDRNEIAEYTIEKTISSTVFTYFKTLSYGKIRPMISARL